MCGALYNVHSAPEVASLHALAMINSGVDFSQIEKEIGQIYSKRPQDVLPTIIPASKQPSLFEQVEAKWWLKLKYKQDKWVADNKFSTFNVRTVQIQKSPLHRIKPVSRRSIVLAEGYFEWQNIFVGDKLWTQLTPEQRLNSPKILRKQLYLMRPYINGQLGLAFFAALTKRYDSQQYSTAIITLPSHPRFRHIHHKSFVLSLIPEKIEDWLNPTIPTKQFVELFERSRIYHCWQATPVESLTNPQAVGLSEYIEADE